MVPESLLGTIVGGIIGFGSSMGVLFIQRWIIRPVISIDENSTEVGMNYRETDPGQVLTIDEKEAAQQLVEFIATRIKVRNTGSTAAENCKASIIMGANEFRVGWMLPKEDLTVTINAHDSEYIDLCASSTGTDDQGRVRRLMTTERGYRESQQHARPLP
ncbi:MAG TPA: hypothetical protein VFS97_13225 [Nitrososphaeraceae archaeon]|nr:hypothetical protein [Nitrososphaeraceae archaeon]